ncbi:ABC transporter substrate-binding protein [Paracraurococcus ruber]|uniref:ABC transporter substrate-binding protein n=1 Tax=Paracraurococcus ruber TaxID=77675 RepID=A0ABS1CQE8_9PROT|nr:ABC transporter substrate-binding protein [Paracraurococcus ruber]MBK1656649.1 ABC transporter substrate-binding protein [Paracraurococcus ruber]TDG33728.1 ABC transporter substrate-binding protein [Paracraurococcus ruber]
MTDATRRALLGAAPLVVPLAVPRASRAQSAARTLRVGNQRGGLRSLLEASGVAQDLPYRIEWSEFPAAQPLLEALNAHAVDLGTMGDLNFFSVYSSGAPITAIAASRSDGASQAIVVRGDSPIRGVADLRGKRVAAARGGWTHYSLLSILHQAGIPFGDVRFAWLLPAEAALAFRTGEVDAWSIWEPYTSLEVLNFGARVLADARGLTPSASVLAVNNRSLAERREQLLDFVRRDARAWAWAQENRAAYARVTAQAIRQPEPVLLRAYEVNRTRAVPIDAALVREFQQAVDRAHAWGVIPGKVSVADAVDQSFTRDLGT